MRLLPPLLALLLLLTGCGRDGSTDTPAATTTSVPSTSTSNASPQLDADTPLSAEGVGPVKAGMTLAEVREAGGRELVVEGFADFEGFCWFGHFQGLKEDFALLFLAPERTSPVSNPDEGVLGRVSVESQLNSSPARTEAGVGVGSTKAEVLKAYADDVVEVTPHRYTEGGEYIDVSGSQDPVPTLLRFETDTDDKVTSIHGGLSDAARLVEGCA
ncbi:MAG TPA: hypothetical protein VMY88_04415 [Acidimicrobiales bacterium]|nr:hypothetical protein [Acidimicrobiales bacterium]